MMKALSSEIKSPFLLEEIPVSGKVHYQVLCVHGLNQNPTSLKPLLEDLAEKGIRCFLLHLPGHSPVDEKHDLVNKDMVFSIYEEAYQRVKNQYAEPLGFVGYSFGGLIGTAMLDRCRYDKVALLAPALKLRPYTHGIRPLLPYLSKIFSVPLGNAQHEKRYRFHHQGVPREVYKSFFDIYDEFHKTSLQSLEKTKGLVFSHPKDELVSYKALEKWIKANSSWSFQPLSNKEAEFGRYRHLIFDQTTLGLSNYRSLLEQMSAFFIK